MIQPTTNVHTLPARRRDDAGGTHRSTPAYAVPVPPPLPFYGDEPFADAMLAQDRAKRAQAAGVALARRTEERMQAEQLQRNQLVQARTEGHNLGLDLGFKRGWYWGLGFGVLMGGTLVYLCAQFGRMVVRA